MGLKTQKFHRIEIYVNNLFWLFLTYLLAPFFYFLIFLRTLRHGSGQGKKKSVPLKILIIQTGKIGDLVCATPVFREIKKKFPSAHLTALILSKTKGVLKNNPRIDKTILITDYVGISGKFRLLKKLRKERYDWAINFFPGAFTNIISFWSLIPNRVNTAYKHSGEIIKLLSIFNNYRLEYKKHTPLMKHYLNLLKFIGTEEPSAASEGGEPRPEDSGRDERELFILPEEEKKAAEFLKERNLTNDDFLVGVSCAAGVKLKEWGTAKFAELADKLIEEKNGKIIFIGSPEDVAQIEEIQKMMKNSCINAAGHFELEELPALLKKLKLFIAVDTGPLYMAAALDVPVIDIAGPVNFNELYPLNAKSKIIQKKIYCVPCSHMLDAPRSCKEGHLRCLKEITVQEVFNAANNGG